MSTGVRAAAILALDTSGDALVVAVASGGSFVGGLELWRPRQHASSLPGAADGLVRWCGLEASDLAAVAVVLGPGSYTGLRVGIATAQGMAAALEVPALPVAALDVAAETAGVWPGPTLAAVDVRHGRVHRRWYSPADGGVRRPEGDAETVTAAAAAAEWVARATRGDRALLTGGGAPAIAGAVAEAGGRDLGPPCAVRGGAAAALARVAWRAWEGGQAIEPVALAPVYLRPALQG